MPSSRLLQSSSSKLQSLREARLLLEEGLIDERDFEIVKASALNSLTLNANDLKVVSADKPQSHETRSKGRRNHRQQQRRRGRTERDRLKRTDSRRRSRAQELWDNVVESSAASRRAQLPLDSRTGGVGRQSRTARPSGRVEPSDVELQAARFLEDQALHRLTSEPYHPLSRVTRSVLARQEPVSSRRRRSDLNGSYGNQSIHDRIRSSRMSYHKLKDKRHSQGTDRPRSSKVTTIYIQFECLVLKALLVFVRVQQSSHQLATTCACLVYAE